MEPTLTFEATRDAIEALPTTPSEGERTLVWVEPSHVLAVARDARGQIEIFLACEQLVARDRVVQDNLQHQLWTTAQGEPLPANRLVLPGADHFDGVAAFICAELLEQSVSSHPVEAFSRSEAIIALALRRATLSDQALVGLAGELFVLARLVDGLPAHATTIIENWFGSGPSTRDLQLGTVGVEIKTTTASASIHHIQGLHQVERGVPVDGAPETEFFLLSVGIEWLVLGSTTGRSVPELVEAILSAVPDPDLRETFLSRVKQYGGDAGIGYDHVRMSSSPRYTRRFQARFERLYDMADDQLKLVSSQDVIHASHVDIGSINFRINLPNKVRGDVNPISGMPLVIARLGALLSSRSPTSTSE